LVLENAARPPFGTRYAEDGYPRSADRPEREDPGRARYAINVNEAYFWARTAERRLADNELRKLAEQQVRAAARLMPPEEIAAAEAMVEVMLVEGRKPSR
jgi:hypothetical protein